MSVDRDRTLEQALKLELRTAGTPAAGACLDAETLGAWTDGGLNPAALAAAEAHVANCARCQALVGTMLKGAPGTDAPGTLGTTGTLGTLSLWKWWLAPIAAGVTAATLWMVVPEQQQVAVAPAEPPAAEAIQPPPVPESIAKESKPDVERQRSGPVDNLAAASRSNRDQSKLGEERKDRKEEAPARPALERAALADAARPAAPPAAQVAAPAAAPAALAESVTVLEKSGRSAAVIEIATLDPSLGWRIVGDRIERSDNGGTMWTVKRQNPGDGIVAGSAPSNAVGWFVGRAGRVLLTIDSGSTFTDVSLGEPLDLASIAAIDARNASIYSVVGRRFRTDDGGRTWRPF